MRQLLHGERLWSYARYVAAAAFAVVLLVPLLWAISGSFHTNATLFSDPFRWIPKVAHWENYTASWGGTRSARICSTALASRWCWRRGCLPRAHGRVRAGKCKFLGRDLVFSGHRQYVAPPFPAILIPVFIIATKLGIVNTYLGVIVPGLLTAQVVFFMRQYVLGIPDELIESARVDGARAPGVLENRPAVVLAGICVDGRPRVCGELEQPALAARRDRQPEPVHGATRSHPLQQRISDQLHRDARDVGSGNALRSLSSS